MNLEKNLALRLVISEYGLRYSDVARKMHVKLSSLSRMMAGEMTADQTMRVFHACMSLIQENIENDEF